KMETEGENIIIKNKTIDFDSLTLKQKLAQMIIVSGDRKNNQELVNLGIGGIFLSKQISAEDYKSLIEDYQKKSKIRLLVTTDMEGFWNPFYNFKQFPSFSEIRNEVEAYEVGLEQGKLMKELGFNLNFAPVAEFSDKVYGGRVFLGSKKEINNKLENYIKGLQESVNGTCKHYPGKGMIKNTHWRRDRQEITRDDLELFETCFKSNISAVMIGHQIVCGEVDSGGVPSSISEKIIGRIPGNFLIVSDEINMLGLKSFYFFNKKELYKDLINSGENVILDFKLNPGSADRLLKKLEKMVEKKEINEERVDESVKKILEFKGYVIK
ncbi:hypothetical protein GF386_04825, partial [Candidatus Pacearchaeota archaeon]|nr:hypothetical protein [Candidatus Pacearchaeota archaeon]MBD3283436.1 hypothetical protein [Candidatus Pacearchaeota archaeon]